jgi:general secretion pathway protein D
MKKVILLVVLVLFAFANNCNTKLFSYSNSLNPNNRLTIKQFLELLATQQCGINIVYEDSKAAKIVNQKMPFVRIKNYTLNQILDLILKKRGLFYSLNNNELDVSYFKTKTYQLNFISSDRVGLSTLNSADSNITNNYNFDIWGKVKQYFYYREVNGKLVKITMKNPLKIQTQIMNILLNNKPADMKTIDLPVVNKETGTIVVTGTMKQLKAVDNYIKNLKNSLTKEVLIDVKIYTVDLSKSHTTGIDWSKLSLSLSETSVPVRAKDIFGSASVFKSATFNIGGLLNFLAQYGNVNSISNPKIMTLNNQQAVISVGTNVYYKYASQVIPNQNGNPSTQYTIGSKFVGVVLDITPVVTKNGTIIMSIAPRISSFIDPNVANNETLDRPPNTQVNSLLSIVKVKDNDTIVLGGLISTDKKLTVNGVPILKEIPIIKYLFSSRETISQKKELVFVITPHIIDLNKKVTLKDLGFGKIR